MKQTAVEWLLNNLHEIGVNHNLSIKAEKGWLEKRNEIIEQAKAMEKEQHDKTAEEWWKEGAHYMESGGRAKWESFEQYYNKTYGK